MRQRQFNAAERHLRKTWQTIKQLEQKIADFLGLEDTILYAACFDANGGVFEPLFTEDKYPSLDYFYEKFDEVFK